MHGAIHDASIPHVAIVEPLPELAELMGMLLCDEGFRVSVPAAYGDSVDLAAVEALSPDLIVIDSFPAATGTYDVYSELHRLRSAFPTTPVLICTSPLTALVNAEVILHELDIPVLFKPFDILDFVNEVSRLTGKREVLNRDAQRSFTCPYSTMAESAGSASRTRVDASDKRRDVCMRNYDGEWPFPMRSDGWR